MPKGTCTFGFDLQFGKSLKGLVDIYGVNSKSTAIANLCIENINAEANYSPTQDFVNYWKNNVDSNTAPDFQTSDPKQLANAMDKYYNTVHRSIDFTASKSIINPAITMYGYTNAQARNEGIEYVASYMHDVAYGYSMDRTRHAKIEAAKKKDPNLNPEHWSFYCRQARIGVKTDIVKRIASKQNKELKEVINDYKVALKNPNTSIYKWIENQLGDLTVQDRNLLATFTELNENKDYFDEVRNNSNLGDLRSNIKFSDEETLESEANDDEFLNDDDSTDDNNTSQSGNDTDTYMRDIANKGETATTWKKLIPDTIMNYFRSLKRLNSIGNDCTDYDIDNSLGVPFGMDANACMAVMLSRCSFYNIDTMIDDVNRIAVEVPGFAAFAKFAKDLEANPNFAMSVYHFCARALTARVEIQLHDNGFKVKRSNETVDRRTRFLYDIQNDIRNSILNVDAITLTDKYADLTKAIRDANDLLKIGDEVFSKKAKNDMVLALTKYINYICPDITSESIRAYCANNEINNTSGDPFTANAQVLLEVFKGIPEAIRESQANYRSINSNIREAVAYNKKLDRDKETHEPSEYKDVNALYKQDFISDKINSVTQSIAEALLPFSVVKIDLNSRNSEGKNVSNLIDDNFISNLNKILSNDKALNNFAKDRLRSKQYAYSNIMFEQTDSKGNVISRGLFKEVDGKYVPTSYAKDLFKTELFDGTTDTSNENAALYRKMSEGDFVTSAFNMFVNASDKAQYFMRIPSDAPKIFVVTSDKTSTAGLVVNSNQKEINAFIKSKLNGINSIAPIANIDKVTTVKDSDTFAKHIFNRFDKLKVKAKAGANRIVKYNYKTKHSNITYYLQGDVDQNSVMTNPKFIGYDENNTIGEEATSALKDNIYNSMLANGWMSSDGKVHHVERSVNTNHPMFLRFVNAAKQELHEMGIALNAMFVTDSNGIPIRDEKGKLVYKEGWKTTKDRKLKGYKNYHYNGADVVKIKDGKEVLTGNVFRSNKFTIFDMNNPNADKDTGIVNHFQKAIDGMTDFIYGGANVVKFVKKGDEITNVILDDNQQQIINDAISTFIKEYIDDFTNRLSNNKDFIDSKHYTDQNIIDFALNTRLMFYNYDDLFEGNSKFYGNGQNLLKRAKETQMGGTPYGNTNIFVDYTDENKHHVNSVLDTVKIKHITGNASSPVEEDVNIELYDKFTAVTITGSTRHNEELLNNLIKELIDNGTDPDVAETIIKGPKNDEGVRDGGYQFTKVNDAQSYITFEEWVRRIVARGQYVKYADLIDAIYDETKPVNAQLMNQFVQVQKNVYYDLHYDKNTGISAARQIKNAEFVLIPRFIKGTELEQLYNVMKEQGIDQINTTETSKAAKHQELTFWNKEGHIDENSVSEFTNALNANGAKEQYYYNYLYTQLETPHHLNAENKAGVQLFKKIFDNIDGLDSNHPEAAELKKAKDTIINNFCANIKESFTSLMEECGISLNDNGSIELDDNGKPKNLNYQIFFDKLKDELLRLGLDSNSIDYITQIDKEANNGVTKMPIYMGNFGKKLQNIANALFNQAVTRQKLPGFHAVQITQVGWSQYGEKTGNSLKPLTYHPDGNRYIEIALPASAFGLNKNDERWVNKKKDYINNGKTEEEADALIKADMLKEIQDAEIDTVIGYRIPTEGKQSICVMKVVDFIDDALGSTIVVPDEWVAQTGSDFDVDSVYGIQWDTIGGKKAPIKKVNYVNEFTEKEWIKYINKETKLNINSLPKDVQSKIKLIHSNVRKAYQEKNDNNKEQEYLDKVLNDIQYLDEVLNKELSEEDKKAIKEYREIAFNVAYSLQNKESNDRKYNLESLEDFVNKRNKDIVASNTKQARNNAILENMIKILQSNAMLEENLGRSNFEAIMDAYGKVASKAFKKARAARSGYDFLDQAKYQDDAMSGAKLKAFSVTRDNLCSICNSVRPHVSKPVTVTYPKSMFTDKQLADLRKRFEKVDVIDDKVIVTHNTFGWTHDNKNVVGRILTSYSSQTTAHILDAIKEGAIPNVNDFTFCVYKTFPDLGIDYETAIAFMMQPAITELVINYNKNKSIYADNFMSAIESTKRDICKRLGKTDADYCSIKELNDFIKDIVYEDDVRLNKAKLIASLSTGERDNFTDLYNLCMFENLYNIANDIQTMARCLNPDKFGAKQTIYSTRKVFDDINRILNKEAFETPVLIVHNDKSDASLLETIYPNIKDGIQSFMASSDDDSKYKTLCTFLKYASAPSVIVNSALFDTQSPVFVYTIKGLTNYVSNKNNLSEKTYNAFEKYILNTIYNNSKLLYGEIYANDNGQLDVAVDPTDSENINEFRRVYGYNKDVALTVHNEDGELVEFSVKDIDNVTKDELNQFAELSPAQKVTWIKNNYEDAGIFDILNVRLKDPNLVDKNGVNTQRITFNNSSTDIEFVINEFNKALNNSDKLVSMAALDLVKYAFICEGFELSQHGITEIIKNSALYNNFNLDDTNNIGTGIVNDIKNNMNNFIATASLYANPSELYERFIRSHSDIAELPKASVKREGKSFELTKGYLNVINIPKNNKFLERCIKYNIVEQTYDGNADFVEGGKPYKYNKYIKLKFGNSTTVYKVVKTYSGIYLAPLNELMPNETTTKSIKAENNINEPLPTILTAIRTLEEEGKPFNSSEVKRLVSEKVITLDTSDKNINKIKVENKIDLDNPPKGYEGATELLKDAISDYFANRNGGELYIQNAVLGDHIKKEGMVNTDTYQITITKSNGAKEKRKFDIYRLSNKEVSFINQTYLFAKNKTRSTKALPVSLQNLIERHRAETGETENGSSFYYLHVITPYIEHVDDVDEDTAMSLFDDIEEEISNTYSSNNTDAKEIFSRYGFGFHTKRKVNEFNKHLAVRVTAEAIENTSNKLLKDIYAFNNIGALDSDEVIDAIIEDENLRRSFLDVILRAKDFVDKHASWDEFNITGEDTQTIYFINKIKNAITAIRGLDIIKHAKDRFIQNYVAKQSTDPRVQQEFISILNSMYDTSHTSKWFHDIQETNNTFLQTILKMAQQHVAAKDMSTERYVDEFTSKIAELKDKAKQSGASFDWSHIIDDKGKFTRAYNDEFVKDLNDHIDAITKAETELDKAKAILAFDKWKIDNVEQRLDKSFYEKKYELDNKILNDAPEFYVKAEELKRRRQNIYDSIANSGVPASQEEEQELEDIRRQLINLSADVYYDFKTGDFEPKYGKALEQSKALKEYQQKRKELFKEYFRNTNKYGFDELLELNQGIIKRKENPDSNGRPQTDMVTLLNDNEYIKAKQWMAEHAHLVPDEDVEKELKAAYKALKRKNPTEDYASKYATVSNAYDNEGVIDARKLMDTQRASIKAKMEANYSNAIDSEDKRLLNNASITTDVYNEQFFNNLSSGGRKTKAYKDAVKAINAITSKYYDAQTRTINTYDMTLEDLQEVKRLMDALSSIRRTVFGSTSRLAVKKANEFREKYTTIDINDKEYNRQRLFAEGNIGKNGFDWFEAWEALNGTKDEISEAMYGKLIAKSEYTQKEKVDGKWVKKGKVNFIDVDKLNALDTIHAYTFVAPTKYWYQAKEEWVNKINSETDPEAREAVKAEYDKWYEANTVFNPYTKLREPLKCWTTTEYTPAANVGYEALWKEQMSEPKVTALNKNYKENSTLADNYKIGNSKYDNIAINDYENEARDYIEKMCRSLVRNDRDITRLKEGYAPARRKAATVNTKFLIKEAAKAAGLNLTYRGNEHWTTNVDYGEYEAPAMNMLNMLKDKSITPELELPRRKEGESDVDFDKRMGEYSRRVQERDAEVHAMLIDKDWENVISDFIREAVHYNAVQDEKELLFFARDVLNDLRVNTRVHNFTGPFKSKNNLTGSDAKYERVKDNLIVDQLETFMHRFLYNEWKLPEGNATKIAGLIQSFTSGKYMMLNLRGGIANVTYGESQIIAECAAGEYFNTKQYVKAKSMIVKSLPSIINKAYSNDSTCVVDAMIKLFNVIDIDDITLGARIPDANEVSRRLRNLAFFQQTSGEYMMQQSALIAMALSHKIIESTDEKGNKTYKLMTFDQYKRGREIDILYSVLDDTEKGILDKYIQEIKLNDEAKRDFVYLKDDIAGQFLRRYAKDKIKAYISKRDEVYKSCKEEFDNNQNTLYDQFTLKNGRLAFKDGSILQNIDVLDTSDFGSIKASDAYQLLGGFKRKVVSVNHKIHGVYDKLGAATIETKWWGSLAMQFHKHLYMGIQKHYKRRGSYNEERQTFEKGMYHSLMDFISIPYRDYKDTIGIERANFMTAIQEIFKSYIDFGLHLKTNAALMTDLDKANCRRFMTGSCAVLSSLLTMIALQVALGGSDDDDDEKLLNLCLYEADRLSSESFMYTPVGLITEGKTLYSSPFATQSFVEDLFKSMNEVAKMISEGKDYNGLYEQGKYAGQPKLGVFVLRNIPIYRQYESLRDIDKSNKYYKIGNSIAGIVDTKSIAEDITR